MKIRMLEMILGCLGLVLCLFQKWFWAVWELLGKIDPWTLWFRPHSRLVTLVSMPKFQIFYPSQHSVLLIHILLFISVHKKDELLNLFSAILWYFISLMVFLNGIENWNFFLENNIGVDWGWNTRNHIVWKVKTLAFLF